MQESSKIINFNKQYLRQLNQAYTGFDQSFPGIPPHQEPILKNLNQRKIIYSLHGFLGVPAEMSNFDLILQNHNLAIYHDIIPGFASTAQIANNYLWSQWTKNLEEKIKFISELYDEVYLMGFSTGGLLLHQFLLNHATDQTAIHKIKGLILFSPFYQPYAWLGPKLNKIVSQFINEISVRSVYSMTRVPDMKIMLRQPQNYLTSVPLKTAAQIEGLGKLVQNTPAPKKIEVPSLCFLSDNDRIANVRVSKKMLCRDFSHPQFQFFKKENVPHHLMVPEANPLFQKVTEELIKFLK